MSDRDKMRFLVFLASVALHSVLGTCDRLRAACGIVKNKRLRGVGYNGSVSGFPHCDDAGHTMENGHCLATRHAEANAITNTDREHLHDGQAILLFEPCLDCTKALVEEGISRIDFVTDYENNRGKEYTAKLLKQKGIEARQHDIDWAKVFQYLFDLLARKGGVLNRAGYRLIVTKEELTT